MIWFCGELSRTEATSNLGSDSICGDEPCVFMMPADNPFVACNEKNAKSSDRVEHLPETLILFAMQATILSPKALQQIALYALRRR
jgi:hypothetical protein